MQSCKVYKYSCYKHLYCVLHAAEISSSSGTTETPATIPGMSAYLACDAKLQNLLTYVIILHCIPLKSLAVQGQVRPQPASLAGYSP